MSKVRLTVAREAWLKARFNMTLEEMSPQETMKRLSFVKKLDHLGIKDEDLELQVATEQLFAKNQRYDLILNDLLENRDFAFKCKHHDCDDHDIIVLSHLVMHTIMMKRVQPGTMASLLRNFFEGDRQEAAKFIELAAECGFCVVNWDNESGATLSPLPEFNVLPETQARLDSLAFIGPLVIPPFPATNKHGSYYAIDTGNVVLNYKGFDKDEDYCLEVLNRAQQTAHEIDLDMVEWVNDHFYQLVQRGSKESPSDWRKRKRQLERFQWDHERFCEVFGRRPIYFARNVCKSGREVYKAYVLNPQGTAWQKACIDLWQKEKVSDKPKLVPWAHPNLIQFSGMDYLKMAIAAAYDSNDGVAEGVFGTLSLGKLPHHVMLSWFARHEHELTDPEFMKKGKKKALPEYVKLVKVYYLALEGKETGAVMSLDGTASGPQGLSTLFRDYSTATLTNVVPAPKDQNKGDWRYNIYQEVFDLIRGYLDNPDMSVDYEALKKAVMTSFYNSKAKPKEVMGTDPMEQDPNNFSEEYKAFLFIMEQVCSIVWDLNNQVADSWDPTATEYHWVHLDGFFVKFPVMVNATEEVEFNDDVYVTSYLEEGTKEHGKSLMAILAHSIDSLFKREMERRLNWDPKVIGYVKRVLDGTAKKGKTSEYQMQQAEKLAKIYELTEFRTWRWLDYVTPETIDKYFDRQKVQEMIDMLPPEPIPFIHIYDDFRAHPNNGNWIRAVYNEISNDLHHSEGAAYLLMQIAPELLGKVVIGERFKGDLQRQANYSLSV